MVFRRKKNKATPIVYSEEDRYTQLAKVARHIEKMRLGEYVEMMNRPGRIIWMNLLVGISRGVGLTIGATLVIAILFKMLTALIEMKIPYLTEMLQEVVQIIKDTPGGQSINMPKIDVDKPLVIDPTLLTSDVLDK